jgi:hypothetical protein
MKNKLFYISAILLTTVIFTSCASRKYGCPNTTGIKLASKAQSITA